MASSARAPAAASHMPASRSSAGWGCSMPTRTAAWSADPRTNSAASSPKRANGSYTADVALRGVAGQQRDHGAGDAGRRAERVAAASQTSRTNGGTKPPEVTGKEACGEFHDSAHRLESKRPQPGRRGVRALEQVRVAERPVDCRNYTPQQPSRVAGIAGGRDGPRQLHPAVLVVQAEERQAKQQVQIVAAWRVTADLGSKRQERPEERVRIRTLGGTQPPPDPIAICSVSGLIRCPAAGRNRPPVEPADHVVEVEPIAVPTDRRREVGVPLAPLGDRGSCDACERGYLCPRNRSGRITHDDEVKCPAPETSSVHSLVHRNLLTDWMIWQGGWRCFRQRVSPALLPANAVQGGPTRLYSAAHVLQDRRVRGWGGTGLPVRTASTAAAVSAHVLVSVQIVHRITDEDHYALARIGRQPVARPLTSPSVRTFLRDSRLLAVVQAHPAFQRIPYSRTVSVMTCAIQRKRVRLRFGAGEFV